jgi:hypothetical protein
MTKHLSHPLLEELVESHLAHKTAHMQLLIGAN